MPAVTALKSVLLFGAIAAFSTACESRLGVGIGAGDASSATPRDGAPADASDPRADATFGPDGAGGTDAGIENGDAAAPGDARDETDGGPTDSWTPPPSSFCKPDCTNRSCGLESRCGTSCGHCLDGTCIDTPSEMVVAQCSQTARVCTAGTAQDCTDSDEQWDGQQCCVRGVMTCVEGDAAHCSDANEHWTGSMCCVREADLCVAGTEADCTGGSNVHWTGSRCCMVGIEVCAPGDPVSCRAIAGGWGFWTGALCCMESGLCGDGTAAECRGAAESWTGTECCVSATFDLCVPGTAAACVDRDQAWSGAECCLDLNGPVMCVEGTAPDCFGAYEHWTGALCCVQGVSACRPDSVAACSDSNEYWTGSVCCRP